MSNNPISWRAFVIGAIAAISLTLLASWAAATYVAAGQGLGLACGSVTPVLILLIWPSRAVQAVFFGAALASEVKSSLETSHPVFG